MFAAKGFCGIRPWVWDDLCNDASAFQECQNDPLLTMFLWLEKIEAFVRIIAIQGLLMQNCVIKAMSTSYVL